MAKKTFVAGTVLRATDVNEYLTSSKNVLINGAYEINQRAFTSTTTFGAYGFDRWLLTSSGGTATYSAQTMNPGDIIGAGGEWTNFARMLTSGQSAAGDYAQIQQRVEDVKTLAGQTVTFSFWAKAATGTPKISIELVQNFGAAGSSDVQVNAGAVTISTSWARYSVSAALPSVAGKTINAGNYLRAVFWFSAGTTFAARTNSIGAQNNTFDIWGVQLEEGAVATPFARNANSFQGELAACQRYACVIGTGAIGKALSSTLAQFGFTFPVEMRTAPVSGGVSLTSNISFVEMNVSARTGTAINSFDNASTTGAIITLLSSGLTAPNMCAVTQNKILVTAEL